MVYYDHSNEDEFNQYFEYTNNHPEEWGYIIREARSINNSVEIIRELEKLKKRIAILTKVYTLYEMKTKVEDLRKSRNIQCPVFFVPPGIKKHQIVIPNNQILIDDSKKNVKYWIENGGRGFIFDSSILVDQDNKVKSLEFLLKR